MFRARRTLLQLTSLCGLALAVAPTPGCSPSAPPAAPASPGDSPYLQNPRLTPGATARVSLSQVCAEGYAETVRDVPIDEKEQVYAEYGITHHAPGAYEVDHLIPLELGGSNSIRNLWPQPYKSPWNAHVKDKLEDALHHRVCSGQLDLQAAQQMIRTDWVAAYRSVFHRSQPGRYAESPGSWRQGAGSGAGGYEAPGYTGRRRRSWQPGAETPRPGAGAGQVWVNTGSGKFFQPGSEWYGRTRRGEYMSEQQAVENGYRPAKE